MGNTVHAIKKTYEAPVLDDFGPLSDMTQTGGSRDPENGKPLPGKKP